MKIARIVPLFEGGNPSVRNSHRPISILPCLSKLHEGFANTQLKEYADQTNLISMNEFAYRKNSVCLLAPLLLIDQWKWAIDRKSITVAAYLDLRKAFDIINHDILLSKLDMAGITGTSYNWFKSYLTDRKQFVTYKDTQSEVMDLNYGVPQGSVCGPSLFSIHFDGVLSSIKLSNCTLYADNTELHASDCTAASAAASMNCDLVNIDIWYQILINPWL